MPYINLLVATLTTLTFIPSVLNKAGVESKLTKTGTFNKQYAIVVYIPPLSESI